MKTNNFRNFTVLVDVSRSVGHCEIITINLTKSRNWFVLNAVKYYLTIVTAPWHIQIIVRFI